MSLGRRVGVVSRCPCRCSGFGPGRDGNRRLPLLLNLPLPLLLVVALWLTSIHAFTLSSSTNRHWTAAGRPSLVTLPGSSSLASSSSDATEEQQSGVKAPPDTVPDVTDTDTNDGDTVVDARPDRGTLSTLQCGNLELGTALFAGGLAFDAYVEPPSNSSRWEKGSQGLRVAFCSVAYTRQLYKGVLEVRVRTCTNLPQDESNTAERMLSGNGADACVLVAALEGAWKQDVQRLEKEQYHEGVLDLSGAAHVGRSTTAWANVNQKQSQAAVRKTGRALPYHIPGGWGKGGQAVWPETEEPFYLYVQDPATARLVVTILDDDKLAGAGTPIGSTYKRLAELIPQAALPPEKLLTSLKQELIDQVQNGNLDLLDDASKIKLGAKTWDGVLKMTSKPRKKDKNGQVLAAAAAGAYVAGPVGAAAGALLGSFYEGTPQGSVQLQVRYLPIPPNVAISRQTYVVKGGMPGVDWGTLLERYKDKTLRNPHRPLKPMEQKILGTSDLEHCFFINHDKTGATCSVYRSLDQKLIVVSFRGTCAPVDLITDANLVQEAWVEGDDVKDPLIPKVHQGFRSSLNSISRRLKELLLATVQPGDNLSDYDMLVTGHSLGGALATLFVADLAQYGIDAGRGLPQLEPSEPWWKGVADTFMGQQAREKASQATDPPRPKTLRLYNFGSPRVGNDAFSDLFAALQSEQYIDQAYRIVNGQDVVARMPRTLNALVTSVGYEHCGTTVLIAQPSNATDTNPNLAPLVWVEGESDDNKCPVRDGVALTSPLAEGSLLSDLMETTRDLLADETTDTSASGGISAGWSASWNKWTATATKVSQRFQSLTATDVASVLGLQREFTTRELELVQALLQGKALAHHLEDEYYAGMGRATGFLARVGEDVVEFPEEA